MSDGSRDGSRAAETALDHCARVRERVNEHNVQLQSDFKGTA